MTKISKNIKKFRTRAGLTQAQFAQDMCVTRQTISSWETDRTQPDINTLATIAEYFNLSIEELIYGERRKNDNPDEKGKENRKVLTIILTSLGSLFTFAGVIILFAFLWGKMPFVLQSLLSVLPLALGSASAVFVFMKKRDSTAFCEVASILWAVGLVATNALLNSVCGADLGFDRLVLIDAVLILPVSLIFNSVSAFVGYCALLCITAAHSLFFVAEIIDVSTDRRLYSIILLLYVAVAVFLRVKAKLPDAREILAAWLTAICAIVSTTLATMVFFEYYDVLFCEEYMIYAVPIAFLATLFLCDNGEKDGYRFSTPSLIGLSVALTVTGCSAFMGELYFDPQHENLGFFPLIISVVLLAVGFVLSRKHLMKKDKLKLPIALSVLMFLVCFTMGINVLGYIALIFNILLIVSGVINASIGRANIGLLGLCGEVIFILWGVDINIVAKGIGCVLIGILLIITNRIMIRAFAKKAPTIQKKSEEVETDA